MFPPSLVLAYSGVIPLALQAALLHPYYESSPNGRLFRMALLPLVVYITVASVPFRTLKPLEGFLHLNFPLVSIPSFHIVCLAIIFAFHHGDVFKSPATLKAQVDSVTRFKTPEKETKQTEGKPSTVQSSELDQSQTSIKPPGPPSLGELVKFVTALIFSPRGLQCTWAPPEHVVALGEPMSISRFVGKTIARALVMNTLFMAVCAFAVPAVQNPKGAYGFLTEELGLPGSSVLETLSPYILTVVFGGAAYAGFSLLAYLFNLVEVAVNVLARMFLPEDFKPEVLDPVWYPPLFSSPWTRDNLTDFWSKGWHAAFRYNFIFCGALPLYKVFRPFGPMAGKIAGLAGAMLVSAAMHEISLAAVTKVDWTFSTGKMFLGQGLGIVLESIFKQLTGRKVGGPVGRIWTNAHVLLWGRPCVDAWVNHGLGKSGVPRHSDWPLARFLIPFGPVLPEMVFELLRPEFWRQFLSKALTWQFVKSLIWC